MASPYQQSSSGNSKNEPGHPEGLRGIPFSSESSASSVQLSEDNLRSQHETISKSPIERWLHETPREGPWSLCVFCTGGIEQRGQRPPTPYLAPRLAEQPISSGNGGSDSPRCTRCNRTVCIKDICREMLTTDVLKLARLPVPNDPTSFRYVCPIYPMSPNVRLL